MLVSSLEFRGLYRSRRRQVSEVLHVGNGAQLRDAPQRLSGDRREARQPARRGERLVLRVGEDGIGGRGPEIPMRAPAVVAEGCGRGAGDEARHAERAMDEAVAPLALGGVGVEAEAL